MMLLGTVMLLLAGVAPSGDPPCLTSASPASLAKRASPLDSVSLAVGGARIKVCYGRPSSRGRTMLGGANVPWGRLWRTGANEPTMLHLTGPAVVAGVRLEAGSYSLYTVPNPDAWEIILNRSVEQWGDEGSYTEEIRKLEIGRGKAKAARTESHVEQFTIRPESRGAGAILVLEWERTRVAIPVSGS